MNFVRRGVIAVCCRPTNGNFSPVTVLIEFRAGLIFSDNIFSDGKRVELTIAMLLSVSIITRHVTFSTIASSKTPWKFSDVNYLFLLRSYFLSLDLDLLLIQLSPVSLVICITPIAAKRIVPLTPIRQTAIMLILTSLPATSPRIPNVTIPVSIAFCLSLPKKHSSSRAKTGQFLCR